MTKFTRGKSYQIELDTGLDVELQDQISMKMAESESKFFKLLNSNEDQDLSISIPYVPVQERVIGVDKSSQTCKAVPDSGVRQMKRTKQPAYMVDDPATGVSDSEDEEVQYPWMIGHFIEITKS